MNVPHTRELDMSSEADVLRLVLRALLDQLNIQTGMPNRDMFSEMCGIPIESVIEAPLVLGQALQERGLVNSSQQEV